MKYLYKPIRYYQELIIGELPLLLLTLSITACIVCHHLPQHGEERSLTTVKVTVMLQSQHFLC